MAKGANGAPDEEKAKETIEKPTTGVGPFISDVVSGLVGSVAIALLATNWVVFSALGSTPVLDILFPVGGEGCEAPCLSFPDKGSLAKAVAAKEKARQVRRCSALFANPKGSAQPCSTCTKSQARVQQAKNAFAAMVAFLKKVGKAILAVFKKLWAIIKSLWVAIKHGFGKIVGVFKLLWSKFSGAAKLGATAGENAINKSKVTGPLAMAPQAQALNKVLTFANIPVSIAKGMFGGDAKGQGGGAGGNPAAALMEAAGDAGEAAAAARGAGGPHLPAAPPGGAKGEVPGTGPVGAPGTGPAKSPGTGPAKSPGTGPVGAPGTGPPLRLRWPLAALAAVERSQSHHAPVCRPR